MKTCSVELLLKISTLVPEMAIHEKALDYFIDMLRKDQVSYIDILFLFYNFFFNSFTLLFSELQPCWGIAMKCYCIKLTPVLIIIMPAIYFVSFIESLSYKDVNKLTLAVKWWEDKRKRHVHKYIYS